MNFGIKKKRGAKEKKTIPLRIEWIKTELHTIHSELQKFEKTLSKTKEPCTLELEQHFLKITNIHLQIREELTDLLPLLKKEAPQQLKEFKLLQQKTKKILSKKTNFKAYCQALKR